MSRTKSRSMGPRMSPRAAGRSAPGSVRERGSPLPRRREALRGQSEPRCRDSLDGPAYVATGDGSSVPEWACGRGPPPPTPEKPFARGSRPTVQGSVDELHLPIDADVGGAISLIDARGRATAKQRFVLHTSSKSNDGWSETSWRPVSLLQRQAIATAPSRSAFSRFLPLALLVGLAALASAVLVVRAVERWRCARASQHTLEKPRDDSDPHSRTLPMLVGGAPNALAGPQLRRPDRAGARGVAAAYAPVASAAPVRSRLTAAR